MKLIISNVSGVPIYEQIKQQIKAAILSGELQAEETLPSLRTLAKDLKISVLTVTKAYTELEQEGFVKNVQGRGCFVMGSGSELIKEQLICKVENNLTEAIKAADVYKRQGHSRSGGNRSGAGNPEPLYPGRDGNRGGQRHRRGR